jgi:hypothetical protein
MERKSLYDEAVSPIKLSLLIPFLFAYPFVKLVFILFALQYVHAKGTIIKTDF